MNQANREDLQILMRRKARGKTLTPLEEAQLEALLRCLSASRETLGIELSADAVPDPAEDQNLEDQDLVDELHRRMVPWTLLSGKPPPADPPTSDPSELKAREVHLRLQDGSYAELLRRRDP